MDQLLRKRVAAEVLAEMARRRMSRETLARQADMALSTLNRRLTTRTPFTYDELAAIADVFDMSTATLIARAEEAA